MELKVALDISDDIGQIVEAATIVKWHKREGELVDYGDNLLDLRARELGVPEFLAQVSAGVARLKRAPARIACLPTSPVGPDSASSAGCPGFSTCVSPQATAASSAGSALRKGTVCRQAGHTLALFWSDLDPRLYPYIVQEAFGIMRELNVF